jgi:hypothetical protein
VAPDLPQGVPLALEIIVDRPPEQPKPLSPGGRVTTGETMHFELTHAQGGYVAVLGLSEGPSVKIFTPRMKQATHLRGPGKTLLPDAIVVDDQVGKQRIIALVCPTEVLPLMLNLAGHRAAIDHPFLDDIKALALPCAQAGVSIEKVPVANISIGDDAGAWH